MGMHPDYTCFFSRCLLQTFFFLTAVAAGTVTFSGQVSETTVVLGGTYFAGTQNISVGGRPCMGTEPNFGLVVSACTLTQTRDAVCAFAHQRLAIIGASACALGQTPCTNVSASPLQNCTSQTDSELWCSTSLCTNVQYTCIAFWVTRYGGNSSMLVGAPCGAGMVCNEDAQCVPDNPPWCPSSLECQTSGLPPGVLSAVVTNANGTVQEIPDVVVAVQPPELSAVAWANTSAHAPLFAFVLSAGTPFGLVWLDATLVEGVNVTLACDFAVFSALSDVDVNGSTAFSAAADADLKHNNLVALPATCTVMLAYTALQWEATVPSLVLEGTLVAVPAVYSTCPDVIIAGIASSVTVQGDFFAPFDTLLCLVDGAAVAPAFYLNRGAVVCTFTVGNESLATDTVATVSVTNDGVTYAPPVSITVLAGCAAVKPNSVNHAGACECPPGFEDMGAYCQPCPVGSYQPAFAQPVCIACPADHTTLGAPGETVLASCVCKPGFYSSGEGVCLACPAGFSCNGTASIVLPGFWRAANASMLATPCGSATQCPGGSGFGESLCAAGYKGPLCQVCRRGFGTIGGQCLQCPPGGVSGFLLFVVIGTVVAAVILLVRTTSTYEWSNHNMGATFKVAFAYFQILYYVGKLAADWSSQSSFFFAALVPVTLSPSFVAVQCPPARRSTRGLPSSWCSPSSSGPSWRCSSPCGASSTCAAPARASARIRGRTSTTSASRRRWWCGI